MDDLSDLEHRTYKEVQEIAKGLGLNIVGKDKPTIVAAIEAAIDTPNAGGNGGESLYTGASDDSIEEITNMTTTSNFGKDGVGNESIPKIEENTKLVKVKLRKKLDRCTIGNCSWELKAGKLYEVPENVAQILSECGYL